MKLNKILSQIKEMVDDIYLSAPLDNETKAEVIDHFTEVVKLINQKKEEENETQ